MSTSSTPLSRTLFGLLLVAFATFTSCSNEPDCGIFNAKVEDLPPKMADFFPHIDPTSKVCVHDSDFVMIYYPDVADLDQVLQKVEAVEKGMLAAGYKVVEPERGIETTPYDSEDDPLRYESRSRTGISYAYEKDGFVLSVHYNLIGLYEHNDYLYINITDDSDDLLPSETDLRERLASAIEQAQIMTDLVNATSGMSCDAAAVKELGNASLTILPGTSLETMISTEPEKAEFDFRSFFQADKSKWTLDKVDQFIERFPTENRYFLVVKAFKRVDPQLIFEGTAFEAGKQYESGVLDGSFLPGSESGRYYLVDWKEKSVLCVNPYSATSSADITYDINNSTNAMENDLMGNVMAFIRKDLSGINPELAYF